MYPGYAVQLLQDTLAIMNKYADHTPPVPEEGRFYRTRNDSIVYVYKVEDDGEAQVTILTGGHPQTTRYRTEPGETYRLTPEGYHADDQAGPHLVMALREKLDLRLPA